MSACAIAAPAKPPIKVCEEEEGIPYHQVSKFQKIAAIKPEKIIGQGNKVFVNGFANRVGYCVVFKNPKCY